MKVGKTLLGQSIEIPARSFATAGTAILAMRGAGKSWLNGVLTEQLAKEGIPFVIVDPEGEYWTLRVQFSNVVVAGGEHADIPLETQLAQILGRTTVEERLQLVLDLSDTKRNEQMNFLSKFLSEVFVKETELRIPLWICFEEADIWVPQSGNPPSKTHVLDICQRGRKRGLGFALVSQRPATLDKTALSQAEFRFFKRFQQPHDLRAVGDYLGSYSSQIDILPSLAVEEALMYAPTILESPVRMQVASRICPHGGATPGQIAKIKPSTTTLDLREKIEKILKTKKRELNELQKRDVLIQQLGRRIEELEENIEKIQLASDVAHILGNSGMKEIQKEPIQSESYLAPHLESRKQSEVLVTSSEELTPLKGESIVFLGSVSVNAKSGLVLGNNLADLLLNRLELDERVVFLTLRNQGTPSSATEISREIAFSVGKTRRIFRQLEERGVLRKAGRNKRGDLYMIRTNQRK